MIFRKSQNLDLNFDALAGYDFPFMPFSLGAARLAFPNMAVKGERIKTEYMGDQDVCVFYQKGKKEPAFYADVGNGIFDENTDEFLFTCVRSIYTTSPQCTAFGYLRVGETLLRDYRGELLKEIKPFDSPDSPGVFFWEQANCISVLTDSLGSGFGMYRLTFDLPKDFTGSFAKATEEDLGRAVLSEICFFMSSRDLPEPAYYKGLDATKLMKKMISGRKKGKYKKAELTFAQLVADNRVIPDKPPIQMLLDTRFDEKKAQKSYVSLMSLICHNCNTEDLTARIKSIFKANKLSSPDTIRQEIIYTYTRDKIFDRVFIHSMDSKAEIDQLYQSLNHALGDKAEAVNLPKPTEFDDYLSISAPGVFEQYTERLKMAGYELWHLHVLSDQVEFVVFPKENAAKVERCLKTAFIN